MPIITALFQFAVFSMASTSDIETVIRQERSFASDSIELGFNESFVKHLSGDAWIFRPFPLRAGGWLAKQPHDASRLEWGPQFVEVSGSGDLALSSGPWHIGDAHDAESKQLYGHFMSVWKRGSDGVWKVICDHGIVHPKFAIDAAVVARTPAAHASTPLSESARSERLLQLEIADDELRAALRQRDAMQAYRRVATADALILRPGVIPQPGILPSALSTAKRGFGAGPRRDAGVSDSGDLGFTVGGDGASEYAGRGVYERVWRFEGNRWRLSADVTTATD